MNPSDIEDLGAQDLGAHYGADYFERYGRGPCGYETGAPYRHGEPLWERYFSQIADLIVSELAPRSVLDAGCAIGFLVEALRQRDVEAWGLDISEFAIEHVPDSIRPFCRVGSLAHDLERDYDLIVCMEVLEHLPPHLAGVAVANLCRHTHQVLFSASPDGFRDPTHLNVRPSDYWVELFGRHGSFRNLDVDASVVAPQAIHFLRADQTAVSVAAAYERWHWHALTELRDLRAARQLGAEAVVRAEEAEAEMNALRHRLEEGETAARRAEDDVRGLIADLRRQLRMRKAEARQVGAELTELRRRLAERDAAGRCAEAELRRRLAERDAAARRAEAEIAAINRTHLFRYAAGSRRVYARLRRRLLVHHHLDLPAAGQVVEPDLLLPVQGWVVSEQSAVARIDVFVNGVDCGRARLIVRQDVVAAFPRANALLAGFETLVDLRTVPRYEDGVRIELQVETLAGDRHALEGGRVELVPPGEAETRRLIHHYLDLPAAGQVVEPDLLLPVQGWVVSEQSAVARIDVFVNGVDCGRARLGIVRHDVMAAFPMANALLAGFETLVDLRTVPRYEDGVRIELQVETLAGDRHALEEGRVELVPPGEAETVNAGYLEKPRTDARRSRQADIRLLVFTHDLGFGGGQLYLFELLRLLARGDEFEATVVAPRDGPLRRATEELGIPVVVDGGHPVESSDEYETRQAQLMAWAREGGFNAVLANTFGSFRGIDLAARLGVPGVWAIHESFDVPSFWRAAYGSADAVHPIVKVRAERALASAAAVVFEADATRCLYAPHGDASRFITIPYGIDIDEIDRFATSTSRAEARAKLGLAPKATVLLCLGTIEPRKAQLPLAQAFRAVASAHPDAVLAFVGAMLNPFSAGLEQFVERVGLSDRVRVELLTEEIYPWYRAADALLCVSDVESLPRTVLEAMAFSVPVIATRVFGLPELIDDGVTGYLCEPRDTAQLVKAIDRFFSTPHEERAAVGAAGAAVVRKRHDSRGYAEAYHRLLRSLIEDPSRAPTEILAAT